MARAAYGMLIGPQVGTRPRFATFRRKIKTDQRPKFIAQPKDRASPPAPTASRKASRAAMSTSRPFRASGRGPSAHRAGAGSPAVARSKARWPSTRAKGGRHEGYMGAGRHDGHHRSITRSSPSPAGGGWRGEARRGGVMVLRCEDSPHPARRSPTAKASDTSPFQGAGEVIAMLSAHRRQTLYWLARYVEQRTNTSPAIWRRPSG